jgi:ferredoxin
MSFLRGMFAAKKQKCAKCGGPITDSPEEAIRRIPDWVAGMALRDSIGVVCGQCGKKFCVGCIERAGNHQHGGLPCPSCHGQMGGDLPAALPLLKVYMMRMYPDLKAGQLEALTRLTNEPLGQATCALREFLSDQGFLELTERMRAVDPGLAQYLDDRSRIPRDMIVPTASQ